MRIYTTRGDTGQTDLLGERVGKDDPRIDLIGTLDEATSAIGLGRATAAVASSAIATDTRPSATSTSSWPSLPSPMPPGPMRCAFPATARLARGRTGVPRGRNRVAARVRAARRVRGRCRARCRPHRRPPCRAAGGGAGRTGVIGNPEIVRYLNRLSSLLFMLARAEDLHVSGHVELAKALVTCGV